MDVLALWLVNIWRLLNLLRQYSGEEVSASSFLAPIQTRQWFQEWGRENTPHQQDQCFAHFRSELGPLRELLTHRLQDVYRNFMKRAVEPVLSPKIGTAWGWEKI